MVVSTLILHLLLPGCKSLKEKRSHIKPILSRVQREFSLSAAEVDHQDSWRESVIACAIVSNDAVFNQQVLQNVIRFVEIHWPDTVLLDHSIQTL